MGRVYYQVRVREKEGNNWVKKSKFFFARSSQDAAGQYKGPGTIMWVEKMDREQLLGIGEFFTLGDRLLKEIREGGHNGKEATNKFRRAGGEAEAQRYPGGTYLPRG